jgi:UDP-N-acetylglucosamine/UDP-N-acetylgalactosamine diphosphorylase
MARLAPHGQQHVLRFWDELSQAEQTSLAAQLAQVDLTLIERLARHARQNESWREAVRRAEPPPAFRLQGNNPFTPAEAIQRGEAALRDGQIGALLVAGGQGTRLGFDHPKGMYPIGPVSGASLFQILFEKLLAVRNRYDAAIPLLLMTSPATHDETVAYLEEHQRFGLAGEDMILFSQGVLPAVDRATGRLLLTDRARLALSPDGHGGVLAALRRARAFELLASRGVRHLFYFQVDNPLVRVCDPEFLGYHLLSDSQASTLAVAKRDPRDKVGNLLSIDRRLRIIEYSEFNQLEDGLIAARDTRGELKFWAGNTAIHVFDVGFLERMAGEADGLPYHVAEKKVACLDEQGRSIEPREPNALKFERFIFDLLPSAERAIVVETDEWQTFAPLKNAPGDPKDSPETVRARMIALHTRWLTEAGAVVRPGTPIEIGPLFALDAEELRRKIAPGALFDRPTWLH